MSRHRVVIHLIDGVEGEWLSLDDSRASACLDICRKLRHLVRPSTSIVLCVWIMDGNIDIEWKSQGRRPASRRVRRSMPHPLDELGK